MCGQKCPKTHRRDVQSAFCKKNFFESLAVVICELIALTPKKRPSAEGNDMGIFTMLSARIVLTNCNPSLYGVYYLTATRCHRIKEIRISADFHHNSAFLILHSALNIYRSIIKLLGNKSTPCSKCLFSPYSKTISLLSNFTYCISLPRLIAQRRLPRLKAYKPLCIA